jgi:hypothetical protein
MKNGGLQVMNMIRIARHVKPQLIRFPNVAPRLNAAAGHPHRKRKSMVIPSFFARRVATPYLVHWSSAELASPDHERRIQ